MKPSLWRAMVRMHTPCMKFVSIGAWTASLWQKAIRSTRMTLCLFVLVNRKNILV